MKSMLHHHVHKILPLEPILSQMTPIYVIIRYFFKIHFSAIFPYISTSPKRSLPLGYPAKNLCVFLTSPIVLSSLISRC